MKTIRKWVFPLIWKYHMRYVRRETPKIALVPLQASLNLSKPYIRKRFINHGTSVNQQMANVVDGFREGLKQGNKQYENV